MIKLLGCFKNFNGKMHILGEDGLTFFLRLFPKSMRMDFLTDLRNLFTKEIIKDRRQAFNLAQAIEKISLVELKQFIELNNEYPLGSFQDSLSDSKNYFLLALLDRHCKINMQQSPFSLLTSLIIQYIGDRAAIQKDYVSFFGKAFGYSREEKIKAAAAVLYYLIFDQTINLNPYAKILKQGSLGETITAWLKIGPPSDFKDKITNALNGRSHSSQLRR